MKCGVPLCARKKGKDTTEDWIAIIRRGQLQRCYRQMSPFVGEHFRFRRVQSALWVAE